jgi:cell division protein FtsB
MAVYQGARPRPGFLLPWLRPLPGRRAVEDPAPSERRTAGARSDGARSRGARSHGAKGTSTRNAARVSARPRAVGGLLGAIVVLFSLAFLSLSQSVRVAATSYDIVRLVSEQDRLSAQELDLRSNVQRLGSEPAIRKEALDLGLGQLGAPLVLPAR